MEVRVIKSNTHVAIDRPGQKVSVSYNHGLPEIMDVWYGGEHTVIYNYERDFGILPSSKVE